MENEEFADLLMVLLYDEVEAAPHSYFYFSLNELAARVDDQHKGSLLDAARILEDRRFIVLALDAFGQVSAFVTPDGFEYVERGGVTGIIARFRIDPGSFLAVSAPPDLTSRGPAGLEPAGPGGSSPESAKILLNHMMNILMTESAMDPAYRQDLLADLETLGTQMGKKSPNPALIDALLKGLVEVEPISPFVRQLQGLLSGRKT